MSKTVELLLTESVENLGIVGDVVKVRTGYARNFLLPRNYATTPSQELIKSLQSKRADAERMLAEQRQMRAQTIERLKGFELTIERSCNDLGHLYASVTQREIATALTTAGYPVRDRDVRLQGAIKRVDNYDIHIKYETELETTIKLHVKADRPLSKEDKQDLDFDNEGNLVERRGEGKGDGEGRKSDAAKGEKKEAKAAEAKADKPEKADKAEKKADPAAIAEEEKPQKAVKKPRADVKKEPAKKA